MSDGPDVGQDSFAQKRMSIGWVVVLCLCAFLVGIFLALPNTEKSNSRSGYIIGPRGGCYYINRNGNKTYVDKSLCGISETYNNPSLNQGKYITGPRGGCYYINRNGNKTYADRSRCR